MTELFQKLEKSIGDRKPFQPREPLLVAVSGGVDSIVLLWLLFELAAGKRWKLTVAHFNHHLRGRSSDADERLVRRTAKALGLKIIVGRGNVRAFAAQQGLSIEMAARQLRHEFLAMAARRLKIRKIVLAHHADDQVELFFLRLLRGAGSEGLSGMKLMVPSPADSQLQIVRPLLEFPKRMLLDYARANGIAFREDASNATLDMLRNRIRLELLPLLRRRYQPAIEPAVLRAMNILGAEGEFISDEAERWLHAASPPAFTRLPVAVQRRVLLEEFQHLELPADFETVEALRLRPAEPVNLAPNLSVSRSVEGLLRVDWHQPLKFAPDQRTLELTRRPGHMQFGGVDVRWRPIAGGRGGMPKASPGREVFDAAAVGNKILLRRWRAGDRFQPIGLSQAAKLQDLFTNAKIPATLRRELVVAENAAGQIFWVEGLRIGEVAKIKATTRQRLVWNWRRLEPKRTLQAPVHRASVAHLTNHGRRQSK